MGGLDCPYLSEQHSLTPCHPEHLALHNSTCISKYTMFIRDVRLRRIRWPTRRFYETSTDDAFAMQTYCTGLNAMNPILIDMYDHRLPSRFEERVGACSDVVSEPVVAMTPMDLWNPYEGSHQLVEMHHTLAKRGLGKTRLLWLRDPYCSRKPDSVLLTLANQLFSPAGSPIMPRTGHGLCLRELILPRPGSMSPMMRLLRSRHPPPPRYKHRMQAYGHYMSHALGVRGDVAHDIVFIQRHRRDRPGATLAQHIRQSLPEYRMKLHSTEMSLVEQLSLFRNARSVIAPHGAGLFWIVVMRPDAFVFEFETANPHYQMISRLCDLRHIFVRPWNVLATVRTNLAPPNTSTARSFAIEYVSRPPSGKTDAAFCSPASLPSCATPNTSRRILVGAMMGFEVDTLEIALHQYRGIADVLVAESTTTHNMRDASTKPLLFQAMKNDSRFRAFSPHHVVCDLPSTKSSLWDIEKRQDACMSDALKSLAPQYDIVVVGSVDEILGRGSLMRLKHCEIPELPTSSVVGMPLGKLGRSFRTDWHYRRYPHSFSLPTIYPAAFRGMFLRSFEPKGKTPIIGGLHMTNYCFLPNIILKEVTATEYAGFVKGNPCNVKETKRRCYDMLRHRVRAGTGEETELPCWLTRRRYPSWFGDVDPREEDMRKAMCLPLRTSEKVSGV